MSSRREFRVLGTRKPAPGPPRKADSAHVQNQREHDGADDEASPLGSTVAERLEIARGNLWISPPIVKHGFDIVTIVVGTDSDQSSDTSQQRFSIHSNLLTAASAYFQAALSGNFQESTTKTIKLPEDIPQAFQVFYNWLYSGTASEQDEDGIYETDRFWLLVYQMADRLLINGLKVIAYERFRACFEPVSSRILPEKRKILPSRDLVAALFDSDASVELFRAWVVDHVLWYYKSSPDQLAGMEVLVNEFSALAAEIGKAVINDKVTSSTVRFHPSLDHLFAKEHGLDSSKIRAESRIVDITSGTPASRTSAKRKR